MRSMNARRCSTSEIATLVAHLRTDDNAKGYVSPILTGQLVPWVGTIEGRDALGGMSTLFENLGVSSAAKATGRRRFLVREAREIWRQAKGDDAKYALLERYIDDEGAGKLANRTITALDTGAELVIVDGNKRAIAIYEAADPALDELSVSVFVLRP